MNGHLRPQDIEKRSFAIITAELGERTFPDGESEVVKRVIHTTADFDYADSLAFSPGAVGQAREALASGATVVTDTNMALAGVNKGALQALGGRAVCYMADEAVARAAGARGVTRAAVSMEYAALLDGPLIFAVGNAPTALIRLHELIAEGAVSPALVMACRSVLSTWSRQRSFLSAGRRRISSRGEGRAARTSRRPSSTRCCTS